MSTDKLVFFDDSDEQKNNVKEYRRSWKLLIVDDEPQVHDITTLAMEDFEFEGRNLHFLHAYSASEAIDIFSLHDEIAVALIDVVMETEHAGLELIRKIRNELNNQLVRIVLRTGQPGQAPERQVIREYDINDYKEKTELSSQKLYSTVYTSIRSFRDLIALEENKRGLEQVIKASGEVFKITGLNSFIQGVLTQLVSLMYLDRDSVYVNCDSIALENTDESILIVAATGCYADLVGQNAREKLPPEILELVEDALRNRHMIIRENDYTGYFQPRPGREDVLYISTDQPLKDEDSKLIELFLHNVSIAYENVLLRDDIEGTQRDMVYMLGEAIETRSRETGQHVRRVSEYCYLIARGMGLSERDAEILRIAAPLHDFGKIGIPDSVLHKPGKLDEDEWKTMKTHSEIGEEMLAQSDREILQAAAILAGHHHEKWDGSGYPRGLAGEDIHIFGRIGAIADVFDALGSKRCYKGAWPIGEIVEFLADQKGSHFDPSLVDWVLDNLDKMQAVHQLFPDEE